MLPSYKDELNKKNVDLEKMITQSTKDYIQHVSKISREEDYLAHIYVRYLGDLRGGQMISKKFLEKENITNLKIILN